MSDPRDSDGSGRASDSPKGAEAAEEIRNRLGGLANELNTALGAIADLIQNADKTGETQGATTTYESPDGRIKASAGVQVRVGGLAAPSSILRNTGAGADTRPASAAKSTADAEAEAPREPLVDIYDEADAWVLTAELPGVEADQLSLAITDEEVVLETLGARRFRHAAPLPAGVDAARATHQLRNGVLEIRLPKPGAGVSS